MSVSARREDEYDEEYEFKRKLNRLEFEGGAGCGDSACAVTCFAG